MTNLKIKLNSEAESEEVKRLAVKAGYKLDALFGKKWSVEFCYLVLCENMSAGFANEIMADGDKPLSIRELREMVNPMKEYLDKQKDGTYKLIAASGGCVDRDWIEIPEGAERARIYNGELRFFSGQYTQVDVGGDHFGAVVWQREQDEPFLMPECTLNDQYAEIEQVRQAIKVKSGSDSDHALDAMSFGIMGARAAQASGGVDATLAERQSTYGNFEDVAFVTENIMSILAKVRVNGLDDLPNTHRMALYMIASKMARIVNGDFNHLDSWHDIGGYSKLIEKLIKGE